MENKFSCTCYFAGHSVKSNYDVQLKLKFLESELANCLQFVAGIGRIVKMAISVNNQEPVVLGEMTVYNIRIDKDANVIVTFKSSTDRIKQKAFSSIVEDEAVLKVFAQII